MHYIWQSVPDSKTITIKENVKVSGSDMTRNILSNLNLVY